MLRTTLLLIALYISLFGRSVEAIQESGEIIIAVYEDYPPYSFMEDGIAKGIDIEVGKKIAASLGVTPKWYFSGFDENLADDLRNTITRGNLIHKNRADVMLRVPYDYDFIRQIDTSTGELENDMAVIKSPYHAGKWAIAVHNDKIESVNTLGIFAYHTIGVVIDTLPEIYLNTLNRGLIRKNVKRFMHLTDAITAFKKGEIDALSGLQSELEYLLSYKQNSSRYTVYTDLPGIKSVWDIGVAVRMDYRPLSYHIDGVINTLYSEGYVEEIFTRFGVTYNPPIARSTQE